MNLKRVLLLVTALALLAAPAAAGGREPRLTVNGKEVAGVQLKDSRTYVSAETFAAAVGGTLSVDAKTGATVIDAGASIPTVAALHDFSPKLTTYEALSPYIPGMGVHTGAHGPHLTMAVSKEGTLNAVEVAAPAALGWQPWYDQPDGSPIELPGMGMVYTQHVYLTPAQGLTENAGEAVILNGRYLSAAHDAKAYKADGQVMIPLRAAVELMGGTIDWDDATWTATVKVSAKAVTYDLLKQLNPALSKYQALSEFVPNMGVHNGVPGPHVTVLTDRTDRVVGFELVSPAAAGWFAWFDQPKDMPMELPGMGMVYTQHIFLVDPASIN